MLSLLLFVSSFIIITAVADKNIATVIDFAKPFVASSADFRSRTRRIAGKVAAEKGTVHCLILAWNEMTGFRRPLQSWRMSSDFWPFSTIDS